MTKIALVFIPGALVAGLFVGALIGRQDVTYWKERAEKNDLAFKLQSMELSDLRKRYDYNLKASLRNQEADANNKRTFEALVGENGKLREGLRLAIDRGMEAERNAMLWRNKCGGAK